MLHSRLAGQISARADLSFGLAYGAWRWAELLDPDTHFSRAACSHVDSMTGLAQFEDLLISYMAGQKTRWTEALEWIRMFGEVLDLDPTPAAWAGAERQALKSALVNAHASVPNSGSGSHKDSVVRARVTALQATELPAFHAKLLGAGGLEYRDRLVSRVRGQLGAGHPGGRFSAADRDLALLASRLLAEGRDGPSLVEEMLSGWATATDVPEALTHFDVTVHRTPKRFTVALSLLGVRRLRGVGPFDVQIGSERSRWPGRGMPEPTGLRQFVDATRSATPTGSTLIVRVEGYDHLGALNEAQDRAQVLADHVAAEHRTSDVSLGASALVLDTVSGDIRRLPTLQSPVGLARIYASGPVAALAGSLRFNRLARQTASPVLAVALHWVAMEGAAAPQSAGSFVPVNASAMLALAAARKQLTAAWHAMRDQGRESGDQAWAELEAWLAVPAGERNVDLQVWASLLAASSTAGPAARALTPGDGLERAAIVLRDTADRFGPWHRRLVDEVAERLLNAGRLSNWVVAHRTRARINLQRMRFMRHRTVHQADLDQPHSLALRQAARDLTDGLYEILLGWLPGMQPDQAMRAAQHRHDQLVSRWSQQGSSRQLPTFDPAKLGAP